MQTRAFTEWNKFEMREINGCTDTPVLAASCLMVSSSCCGSIGPATMLPSHDAAWQASANVLRRGNPSSPPPTVHSTFGLSVGCERFGGASTWSDDPALARFTTYPTNLVRAEIASESS